MALTALNHLKLYLCSFWTLEFCFLVPAPASAHVGPWGSLSNVICSASTSITSPPSCGLQDYQLSFLGRSAPHSSFSALSSSVASIWRRLAHGDFLHCSALGFLNSFCFLVGSKCFFISWNFSDFSSVNLKCCCFLLYSKFVSLMLKTSVINSIHQISSLRKIEILTIFNNVLTLYVATLHSAVKAVKPTHNAAFKYNFTTSLLPFLHTNNNLFLSFAWRGCCVSVPLLSYRCALEVMAPS